MPTPFDQLPDDVRAYAFGQQVAEAADAVAEEYDLDDGTSLVPLVKRVLQGEDPSELIPLAVREIGVPPEHVPTAATMFADLALRPIEAHVGNVDDLIRSWGGSVSSSAEPMSEPVSATSATIAAPVPAPKPAPVRRPPPSPALVRGGDLLAPEDAAELAQHAAKAETVKATASAVSVEPAVQAVVTAAGLTDAESQKRLANIVSARLKDVRDAYATRAELEKPPASGGLGLTGRVLADLMEQIESAAYEAKREADARAAKDKSAHVERGIARRDAGATAREQEEQLLARRYAELTGKAPTKTVGAIGARPTLAMSAQESVVRAAKNIDTGKVRQAVAAAAPPTLKPAVSRPRMEDVRPVRRLAGPVDELRLLTLEDFRRLSKEPKTAMAKVLDQAELLRSQGEDQWFAAVKAWRASPLNGWYVRAMQEALSRGLDVRGLLAEKRAAGEIVPSDAEVDALTQLNGRLRF